MDHHPPEWSHRRTAGAGQRPRIRGPVTALARRGRPPGVRRGATTAAGKLADTARERDNGPPETPAERRDRLCTLFRPSITVHHKTDEATSELMQPAKTQVTQDRR